MRKIFVSATTQGLKPYRTIATEVVAAQGYTPVVQENFYAPRNPIMIDVRRRLYDCDGVLAIAGPYYGEQSDWVRDGIAMSCAQHELFLALEYKRPCLALIATPRFQPEVDAHGSVPTQPMERARLQEHFIAEVRRLPKIGWVEFSDRYEFALALAKHRWEDWLHGR